MPNPLSAERTTALFLRYASETVTIRRVIGRGTNVTPLTVADTVPAYRVLKSGAVLQQQGGADAISTVRFVVQSALPILAKDILIDTAGHQYRVLAAAQTMPGVPYELDCQEVA